MKKAIYICSIIKGAHKTRVERASFSIRRVATAAVIRCESAWNIALARSFYQVTRPFGTVAGCGYLRLPVFIPNMWAMHLPHAAARRSSQCAEAGTVCHSGFMDLVFSLGPRFFPFSQKRYWAERKEQPKEARGCFRIWRTKILFRQKICNCKETIISVCDICRYSTLYMSEILRVEVANLRSEWLLIDFTHSAFIYHLSDHKIDYRSDFESPIFCVTRDLKICDAIRSYARHLWYVCTVLSKLK